jgi:hypothetical protein
MRDIEMEERIINGRKYFKEKTDKFWVCRIEPRKEGDYPSIICDCSNTSFFLKLEHYELTAKCTACGNEEVVYDG